MSPDFQPVETAEFTVPGELAAVAGAATALHRYLAARGLPAARWPGLELVVVEALNNAVEHGLAARPGATLALTVRWHGDELAVAVRDPGRFEPGPDWGELPADPLAEGGRGGFLIRSGTDAAEHRNDATGHTLTLRWRLGPPRDPAAALAATEQTLEGMTEELGTAFETLTTMFGLSELLATGPAFEAFVREALDRVRNQLGVSVAYARMQDEAAQPLLMGYQAAAEAPAFARPALGASEAGVLAGGPERSIESCPALPADDPLQRFPGGAVIVPVRIQDQTLGTVVLLKAGSQFFTAGQVELIRSVCDYIAIVRTNTELARQRERQLRMTRELEIARGIQQSLLPHVFPEDPRVSIHGQCLTAHEVGGDFFDVVTLPDGAVLLVLADVMGKGLPAALLATVLRTSIRARLDGAATPARLLRQVNAQLHADLEPLNIFITAQLGWMAPDRRELRLASAGHCPVFLTAADRTLIRREGGHGIPIGVLADFAFAEETIALVAGMRVVMVTDGLYEFVQADDQIFGLNALGASILALHDRSPAEICGKLHAKVLANRGDAGLMDDCTLIAMEIKA